VGFVVARAGFEPT